MEVTFSWKEGRVLFYDVFVSITDIDHTMLRMRIIEAGCVQGASIISMTCLLRKKYVLCIQGELKVDQMTFFFFFTQCDKFPVKVFYTSIAIWDYEYIMLSIV